MSAEIFSATRAFEREFDELFDFAGASAAAVWNMRWQVRGYVDAHPEASKSELMGHFVTGTGIGGFKFEYFTNRDWSDQEEQIARMVITNVIALYERWLEGVEPLSWPRTSGGRRLARPRLRKIAEALPEPDDPTFANASPQISSEVVDDSAAMIDLYASSLKARSIYEGSNLSSILTHYRFFKELRNQFMHRSEAPDQLLLDAHAAVTTNPYISARGTRTRSSSVPVIIPDLKPRVRLKDAFFACHIVRALVRTLDIELALTTMAQVDVVSQLTEKAPVRIRWKGSESSTAAAFARYITAQGFPRPTGGLELFREMRSGGSMQVV